MNIATPLTSLCKTAACSALLLSSSMLLHSNAQTAESPETWYQAGQTELQRVLSQQANTGRAKNIILFVGDGMGISTVTAARIHDGQVHGNSGEEN